MYVQHVARPGTGMWVWLVDVEHTVLHALILTILVTISIIVMCLYYVRSQRKSE